MKKRWECLFVITLCTVLALSMTFGVQAADIDGTKTQLSTLEKQKKEMEQQIASLEKEKGNVATYIEKLDKQMDGLDKKIKDTNAQVSKTSALLEETRAELSKAKDTQTEQYEIMKARVKYMFENGNEDYFTMLLEADSLEDLLNRAEYINKISEYDQGLYSRYDKTTQTIAKKEAEISKNLEKLNTLKGELDIQKDGLSKLTANKQKELKKYDEKIANNQESMAAYDKEIEEQEKRLQALIEAEKKRQEELRKKQEEERRRKEEERKRREEEEKKKQEQHNNNNSGSNSGNGSNQGTSNNDNDDIITNGKISFRWPLRVRGRITSQFVNRINPVTGQAEHHNGLDIGVPKGTPIVAAASGKVLEASYNSARGNYVVIYHNANYTTIYMHASALKVKAGDTVSKGQTIALVGSTGWSTGNHLHFSIKHNGSYVNPQNYVRQP